MRGLGLVGDCCSLRVSSIFLGFWFVGNDTHSNLLSMVSLLLLLSSLDLSGISLFFELLFSDLLLLHLVDGLNQDVLVLVHVTLGSEVHLSVLRVSDLLGLSVLAEESSESSRSAHP